MVPVRPLLASIVVALLMAGCTSTDTLPADGAVAGGDDHAEHAPSTADDWSLDLTDCHEGGSVAAYERGGVGSSRVPDPWTLADVRQELGDPHISSLGYPMLGAVTGHWHQAIVCTELQLGYVAVAVEEPPFDWGGADRHMLFSGLSLGNDDLRDAVHVASGFEPTRTLRAEVLAPTGDALYAVLDDETKGVYEGWGPVHELATKQPHTVRFWTTISVPGDDGQVPIAFDMTYTTSVRHASTGDSTGLGCHTRTEMHGPTGGLCQLGLIISYQADALTLSYAGAANQTVEHAWHH